MNLKKLLPFLSICLLIFTACDKEDTTPTSEESYYVDDYSGVLVGSTGAYKLHLTENDVTAKIVFDGTTYNLSSGSPLLIGGNVKLTDGTVSMELNDYNGYIEPKFTIPNHTILSTITLSNPNNPNRDYIGWSENYRDGVKVYRTTMNLVLSDNNKWYGIERIDLDINPNDPNHQSSQGTVYYPNGSYTEDATSVSFKWDNGTDIFKLNKVNNTLYIYEGGATTFEAKLTLID